MSKLNIFGALVMLVVLVSVNAHAKHEGAVFFDTLVGLGQEDAYVCGYSFGYATAKIKDAGVLAEVEPTLNTLQQRTQVAEAYVRTPDGVTYMRAEHDATSITTVQKFYAGMAEGARDYMTDQNYPDSIHNASVCSRMLDLPDTFNQFR